MIVHHLKIRYIHAQSIASGRTTFELIKEDDRNFQERDYISFEVVDLPCPIGIDKNSQENENKVTITLKFFDNNIFKITKIVTGNQENGLQYGWCILGFKPIFLGDGE